MFDSSCQHHAVEAFVVMHAPCKRANEVQILAAAPIFSLSSFGRAPLWYGGGGWIETISEHHAPVVQRQRQTPQKRCVGCSNHPRSTNSLA